jgi:hypothetical protein
MSRELSTEDVERFLVLGSNDAIESLKRLRDSWAGGGSGEPGLSTILAHVTDLLILRPMMAKPPGCAFKDLMNGIEDLLVRGDQEVWMFVTL